MEVESRDSMNIILIVAGVILVLVVGWAYFMDYMDHREKVEDLSFYENQALEYMVDGKKVGLDGILNIDPSFDPNYFLFTAFCMFRDAQKAWSNNDIVSLEKYYGSKLLAAYKETMEEFIKEGRRNEIRDILKLSSKLCSYKVENGIHQATVLLTVSCYDYLVATSSRRVINGKTDKKIVVTYLLVLEKVKDKKQEKVICPNCKKESGKENQIRCEYCNQELVPINYNWVITNKKVMRKKEL